MIRKYLACVRSVMYITSNDCCFFQGEHGLTGEAGQSGPDGAKVREIYLSHQHDFKISYTVLPQVSIDQFDQFKIRCCIQGEKGDMGLEGEQGEKGELGLKGMEGPPGNPGLVGIRVSFYWCCSNLSYLIGSL